MLQRTILESDKGLRDAGQTSNINQRAKYKAAIGNLVLTTSNSNLNGLGAGTLFGASSNGALLKYVTVQALGTTNKGMVRLYFGSSGSLFLLDEIEVPAVTQSSTSPAFSVTYTLDFFLQASDRISVTMQNSANIVVTLQALQFSY